MSEGVGKNLLTFMEQEAHPMVPLKQTKKRQGDTTPNYKTTNTPPLISLLPETSHSFLPYSPKPPINPCIHNPCDDKYLKYHQYSSSPNTSISCRIPSCSPSTSSPRPHSQATPNWGPPTSMSPISAPPQLLELGSISQIASTEDLAGPPPAGAEWRCRPLRLGKLSGAGGTVGMEHFGSEYHFWRLVGEVVRKFKEGLV